MRAKYSFVALCAAALFSAAAPGASPDTGAKRPDLSGFWSFIIQTGKIDKKLLPEAPRVPALKGEYKAKYDELTAAQALLERDARVDPKSPHAQLQTSCLPIGMPHIMWAGFSLEILQTPTHLTLVAEAPVEVRRIYLDRPQLPLEDVAPSYNGRSVGHWEGDTLVVDTIGVKPEVLLGYELILPHSIQMRITERIRLVTPDLLQDQITVEDPLALERPFKFTYLIERLPGYETPEFVCDNAREVVTEKGEVIMKLHEE